jgi:hypothetical protein
MMASAVGVKRECYTLCRFEGQTEEALRVRGRGATELEGIFPASRRDLGQRVGHPRRLVPLSPKWNGSQIRRVGLHQQPLSRHEAKQVSVRPFVEGHDAAERHVPTGSNSELRECMRAGIAVEHTDHAGAFSFAEE